MTGPKMFCCEVCGREGTDLEIREFNSVAGHADARSRYCQLCASTQLPHLASFGNATLAACLGQTAWWISDKIAPEAEQEPR